jgi:hypothetical protein
MHRRSLTVRKSPNGQGAVSSADIVNSSLTTAIRTSDTGAAASSTSATMLTWANGCLREANPGEDNVNDWLERADVEATGPNRTDIMAVVKELALANERLLTSDEFPTFAQALVDGKAT